MVFWSRGGGGDDKGEHTRSSREAAGHALTCLKC
jgi:hypothetical protein